MKDCNIVKDWPENELEQVVSCPVCGSDGRRLLYKGLTDKVYYSVPGMWQLQQCLKCESAFLDPRPTPSSIWRAYTNYVTHKSTEVDIPLTEMNFRQRLRRALSNGYINSKYGANLQPSSRLGKWLLPLIYGKQGEIDHALRGLPMLVKGEKRKVLDIGCGSGSFLKVAMQLGWEVQGIDPDSKAASAASQVSGLCVEQGGLPKTRFQDSTFDVVTLSHVIEHTHDPVASLREAYRLLKPGGRIWVATPNLKSGSCRYFHMNWIGLHPPAHLVLFNHKSLRDVLGLAGFHNVRVAKMSLHSKGYFHMSWRISRGEEPFSATGSPLPLYLRLLALVSDLLSVLQINRREEIVMIATKPATTTSAQSS